MSKATGGGPPSEAGDLIRPQRGGGDRSRQCNTGSFSRRIDRSGQVQAAWPKPDWMDRPSSRRPLALVLEDEAMIALNLQDELQDAGYRVAGPFTTCSAALEWLGTATPDM